MDSAFGMSLSLILFAPASRKCVLQTPTSGSKMGKKKSFIDKRNSKTYTLVFRSTEDNEEAVNEEEGDRVLVPADGQGAAAAAGQRDEPPTKHPRALYAHFFGGMDDDEQV